MDHLVTAELLVCGCVISRVYYTCQLFVLAVFMELFVLTSGSETQQDASFHWVTVNVTDSYLHVFWYYFDAIYFVLLHKLFTIFSFL